MKIDNMEKNRENWMWNVKIRIKLGRKVHEKVKEEHESLLS